VLQCVVQRAVVRDVASALHIVVAVCVAVCCRCSV